MWFSSSTRGLFGGGYSPVKDTIDFVTIASQVMQLILVTYQLLSYLEQECQM